jgi:catechol 2,3-dioxygenase-like lactoylglutathione lyase family enzyme
MRIIKLAWVGTRTDNAEPTVAFFRDVLGLRLELEQPGFWMLKLPDGSKVEVFGPDTDINRVRLFWSEPKALLMPAFEVAG